MSDLVRLIKGGENVEWTRLQEMCFLLSSMLTAFVNFFVITRIHTYLKALLIQYELNSGYPVTVKCP